MNYFLLLSDRARLVTKAVGFYWAVGLLGLIGFAPVANAQIVLDFSDDVANQNFFDDNPVARAALEAAVADINSAVVFNLSAVEDVTNGSAGTTSFDFDFTYNYSSPATGGQQTIQDTSTPVNEYRVFVGARPLDEATLGLGGTGGAGFDAVGTIGSGSIEDAIADAQASDTHRRGEGPSVITLNGAFDVGTPGNPDLVPFSFEIGLNVGSLVFNDTSNWHFDHTVPVTAGASDFYSVALHELLHTLGVGTSASWNSLISGSTWLGAEVIASNGTGTGIVAADGDHFIENTMSPRITDGVLQEVVIDPDLTVGTRRELTQLDLAVLRDLGFQTNDFDPILLGDVNLDGTVDFLDIPLFISVVFAGGTQAEADINQDGVVDFLDIPPFIGVITGQ